MNDRRPFAKVHVPCPCGESSDAFCVRHDLSGYCFSCGKNFSPNKKETDLQEGEVTYDIVGHRGIHRKTFEFFGVETKFINEIEDSVAFPLDEDVYQIRWLHKKEFRYVGKAQGSKCFGMLQFDPGSKESIVITEGCFDAMAAYEMLGAKVAVFSVKSSSSALSDLRQHWDYVNSFKKIYFCLDADKAGKEATKACQGLFDFRKVYLMAIGKYNDPNEYLLNDGTEDFRNVFESAKRYAPENIISSFDDVRKALQKSSASKLGTYAFTELESKLYGLFGGDVVVVKAPEGVGKTEFFRAMESHLLATTEAPIGIIHLEEPNGTTVKAIAGYQLGIPATLPDCGLSEEDILDGYRKAVRDDEGRLHIHSSFDVENEDAFLGNIRFLVSAAGCKFIFLDHITWLATGTDDEDERRKLDRISQKLKLLAIELEFCLIMISHVNDDGKTRGSRNITKNANVVISLHRDIIGDSQQMDFLIEKARLGGRSGWAGSGYFDRESGRLLNEIPFERIEDD